MNDFLSLAQKRYAVRSYLDCLAESGKGIFRGEMTGAPMRYNIGHLVSPPRYLKYIKISSILP